MKSLTLPSKRTTLGSACAAAALLAAFWSNQFISDSTGSRSSEDKRVTPENYECKPHNYTTEVVSVDPLLIYINGFLRDEEADLLVELGTPSLASSEIYINNQKVASNTRTSRSAGLPPSSPLVSCILKRALSFLGPALPSPSPSPNQNQIPNQNPLALFGTPQIVQYGPGEHFSTHHDWYDSPQVLRDGSMGEGRWWFNRWGSFFVYLDEGVEGGETWFPHVDVSSSPSSLGDYDGELGDGNGKWVRGLDEKGGKGGVGGTGGTKFLPREGNALFWVNLHSNGTGDERVVHAGMEVRGGRKTAMNIWPRVYYGSGGGGR
ncbi:hypothetical protein DL95DRAFT_483758 [Leptodontidium sp. 2 PMI_412]|nr:hypothetical protein DL95DRAFT_483758 [Leptodontidium sp. 2 PMI_412]